MEVRAGRLHCRATRRTILSLLRALLTRTAHSAQPTVTITTFGQAGLPAGILRHAETEATQILLGAGIRLEWLDCELAGEPVHFSACTVPMGPDRLMLQFIPGSNPRSRRASGLAAIQRGVSAYACVCPERIKELSREVNWEFADLLGHAIAHELGHLLLESTGHSSAGTMRDRWETADLRKFSHGVLVFLPGQLNRAQARLIAGSASTNPKNRAVALTAPGKTSPGVRH